MFSFFRDLFTLSRLEKRGYIVLLLLILSATLILLFFKENKPAYAFNVSAFQKEIKEFEKDTISQGQRKFDVKQPHVLFKFDPNTTTVNQWEQLGLSTKVALRIQNFLKAGGRFREKSDLKKIYGLSQEKFIELEPFIQIDKTGLKDAIQNRLTESKKKIEINTSDSLSLVSIRGIGPVLASRIIKFRKILGGYYRLEQLSEIYGITLDKAKELRCFLSLDTTQIKKLKINLAGFKELNGHPYVRRETAKRIINYRNKIQRINSADELKANKVINDSLYLKLIPYLSFE